MGWPHGYISLMDLYEYLDTSIKIYILVVAFVFGTVMGSFFNCFATRICHEKSIVKGRSECDACGHVLGALDLIPIVSYVISGGKCRYCGAKLSIKYPISEAIGGILFVLIINRFGFSIETIEYLVLACILMGISYADLEDFLIPDRFIIAGIVNRLIFILLGNDVLSELLRSVISGLVMALGVLILVIVMEKVLGKEAMGGGDIKLLFMLGMYSSLYLDLLGLFTSCVIGIVFGLLMTKGRKEMFPFGPSICLGFLLALLYGEPLVALYLSLF